MRDRAHYETCHDTRGMVAHDICPPELPVAVIRRNTDGVTGVRSTWLIARFHSRELAERYAESMNAEVRKAGIAA